MSYDDWIKPKALPESLEILDRLSLAHCALGGHYGAQIGDLVRTRDYAALCEFQIDYTKFDVLNVSEIIHVRQALAFYTKLEDLEIGVDKESVALLGFLDSEATNRETNNRFRSYRSGALQPTPEHARLIMAVRDKIRQVLGSPPCNYGAIGGRFGPGATANVRRENASAVEKLAAVPTCSWNLIRSPLFAAVVRGNESWFSNHEENLYTIPCGEDYWVAHVNVLPCTGQLSFVPKNARTFRSIDVQPTVNGFVQSELGKMIEGCLRSVGVDIRDQERNKNLARMASIRKHLATLDLSKASDSIAYEVVKTLMCDLWFELLAAARTPSTVYKPLDIEIRLEMFSAMGNGFTFPLETLIFWAIVAVVCEGCSNDEIGVYGDDIICPITKADSVIEALKFFGFKVNSEKSFVSGPFRESCGGDYYEGFSIRPFYQKHLVSWQSLFVLHNFYYRQNMFDFARIVLDMIPVDIRLFGPDGYGDGHLLSDYFDKIKPVPRRVFGINGFPPLKQYHLWQGAGFEGYYIKSYKINPVKHVTRYPCDLTTPLYACETNARTALVGNSPVRFSDPVEFTKNGRPMWTYPGGAGVGVVEIYILG